MSEHKIGEQWVEEIDGIKHMYKAVEGPCERCDISHTCNLSADCHIECGLIAKDLGILNDDGLLPCPFCGEYPALKEELDEHDERIYAVEHECNIDMTTGWNHDRQTVIDAWNRRA